MKTFDEWYEANTEVDFYSRKGLAQAVWQHRQTEVDGLQKLVDAQEKHIEMALVAIKEVHKSALDEFMEWDVLVEKAPKICEHLQNLSVAVGELEQALKDDVND